MRRVEPRVAWGHRGWWMPQTCVELRAALRAVGVVRISGRPLGRVRKAQLAAVWRRLNAEAQRRRVMEKDAAEAAPGHGDVPATGIEMEV